MRSRCHAILQSWVYLLVLRLLLSAPAALAAAGGCDDAVCKEAAATVEGYVAAQASAYHDYDYQGWMPFTNLAQAPSWKDVTVYKRAMIEGATCRDQDHCAVRVAYDVIGTLVPLQTFAPRRETRTVAHALERLKGRMVIAGPLPAKFVDVETSIRITGGTTTDSLAFRNIYDGLVRQITEATQ